MNSFLFFQYLCSNIDIKIIGDVLMNEKIEKLTAILKNSNNIVFFVGAGVSTEIPI